MGANYSKTICHSSSSLPVTTTSLVPPECTVLHHIGIVSAVFMTSDLCISMPQESNPQEYVQKALACETKLFQELVMSCEKVGGNFVLGAQVRIVGPAGESGSSMWMATGTAVVLDKLPKILPIATTTKNGKIEKKE